MGVSTPLIDVVAKNKSIALICLQAIFNILYVEFHTLSTSKINFLNGYFLVDKFFYNLKFD